MGHWLYPRRARLPTAAVLRPSERWGCCPGHLFPTPLAGAKAILVPRPPEYCHHVSNEPLHGTSGCVTGCGDGPAFFFLLDQTEKRREENKTPYNFDQLRVIFDRVGIRNGAYMALTRKARTTH